MKVKIQGRKRKVTIASGIMADGIIMGILGKHDGRNKPKLKQDK